MSFFRSADGSWKPIQGVRLIKTQSYTSRPNPSSRRSVGLPIQSEIKRKPDKKKQVLPETKINTMNHGLQNSKNMALKKKKQVQIPLKTVKQDLNQDQEQDKTQDPDQEQQEEEDQDQDQRQDQEQEQDLDNEQDLEQDLF